MTTEYKINTPCMNIYSRPGTKVVFMGINGYPSELDNALKVLKVGEVYTVEYTNVYSSSSSVYLEEVSGAFNTVHFTPLECDPKIRIQNAYDAVTIYVDDECYHITNEELPGPKLSKLFVELGYEVKYEEVY